MARRSARFKAVDEDGDENMEVEDHVDDKEVVVEEGIDDEMDNEGVDAEASTSEAGGSKKVQDDEADEEEENDVDTSMANPAVPNDDQPDDMGVEAEVEVEANTSIGSARPSRRAAQEATKKIEAGKIRIEDNATKKGKGKGKAKVLSDNDSEESEDEEVKPKVKGRGKGKKMDIPSDAESEFEVETKPIKGGKKQILAKAVYWKDIPKWTKGSKSLLMQLPGDIMDNIFGLREELGLAEYVALAGVCKTFRHHLDDDFFQAVCLGKGLAPKTHYDDHIQAWISAPEMKGKPLATAPFSRGGDDWRVPTPRKYTYAGNDRTTNQLITDQKPAVKYYTPRGGRSKWSKAQYTVYKEEKRATRKERWAVRKSTLDAIAKQINEKVNSKYHFIKDGNRSRSVLGKVAGRKNGQPAVEKDEKGIPIVEKSESEEDESESSDESDGDSEEEDESITKRDAKPATSDKTPKQSESVKSNSTNDNQSGSKSSGNTSRARKRAHVSEYEESDEELVPPVKKGSKTNSKSIKARPKQKSAKAWVVPDSSDDESTDELDYMREKGLTIVHDHWPSPWRVMAAAMVSSERINKTNAMKEFKVTEAQLLTLKHYLVPNPMGKIPMQLYIKAAVRALALRAHGGIAKHGAFPASAKDKSHAKAENRKIKIRDMVFEGTYIHKRVTAPVPMWLWGWGHRRSRYDPCICADCALMGQDMSMYDAD